MPNLTYTRDIPDGPHNPSVDQPPMKINTNSIDTFLAVDHFGFNDNNGGWHQQSTYPTQGFPPTTTAGQLALFSKAGSPNLGAILTMVRDNTLGTVTALTTAKIAAPTISSQGITWLPGEILVQWGTVTFGVSSDHVTASPTFNTPFPTNCFAVILTLNVANVGTTTASNTLAVRSSTTAGFTYVYNSSASNGSALFPSFTWWAIGN